MPEYPPGMPSWVDLGSPDVEGSLGFYGGLFAWKRRGPKRNPDGYAVLALRGRSVAGLGPPRLAGPTAAWTTCVTVADVAATAARVDAAGGTVLAGPAEVGRAGRIVVLSDPAGAAIAAWEPRALHGADLVNRPGSFCWSELVTRDVQAAARFYHAVFDWHAATDGSVDYTEWKLVDRTVGGMTPMTEQWPAEAAAHWMVHFAVEDCDAAAATAVELGGAICVPPEDIPPGRLAVVEDPQGAVFSVIALTGAVELGP
jgi:predicted enzyme related to lactoylglutathione lyase